ncbi:hypothetical protein DHD05_18530 [Arenibacter sp. N53]|uniref:hypothetical protein n=1 Tax=Arenibacter TaxID=178469 RepID=UPI000CD3F207|nr:MULTISPECIES: hypothetical protein [Arenibacter]MCM4153594.1 hypothetical protein [Arenibacter sp. N53]
MTYKQIQSLAKKELGRTIKPCWIADVKRELGLTTRVAFNRISSLEIKDPCPEGEVREWLLNILKSK